MKFQTTKNKSELLVEFILPKRIPVQGVWPLGFRMSNALVGALNIGTKGFFWWYLPEYVSRYYEKLSDLESGTDLTLERTPPLRVNWGNLALSENNLLHVAAVYSYLISTGKDQSQEFQHYMRGLACLSKNDIFFQVEFSAFEQFFRSFQAQLQGAGKWDGVSPFKPAALIAMQGVVHPSALESQIEMAEQLLNTRQPPKDIGLGQAIEMKICCDACFDSLVRQRFEQLERGSPIVSVEASTPPADAGAKSA
jgi:hypothetical protein